MEKDRPVATGFGDKYDDAAVPAAERLDERPKPPLGTAVCSFCAPARHFSSEHALKTHVGKMHPAEKARRAHAESVKIRKAQNKAREVN